MENIYNKFFGKDDYFQKRREKTYSFSLSRTGSMPSLMPFQANKLPSKLTGENPYKKRENGVTSSDLKAQILEEKLRNLENMKNEQRNNQSFNPSYNLQLPLINQNTNPLLLQTNNSRYNPNNPLINNNNFNNYKYIPLNNTRIKGEILSSKYKFLNQRGLLKEDYIRDLDSDFEQLRNKHRYKIKEYNLKNHHKHKLKLGNNYSKEKYDEIEKEIKMRKKAKKFHKRLQNEVYTPFQKDYENYLNNVNLNIQQQLKNDNNLIRYDINEIENNYNEIRNLLDIKLNKIEKKQKTDFENLKNIIQTCGGKKMDRAIKNVFDGTNYDLQKAGDEDLLENAFNLTEIINNKMKEQDKINNEIDKELREQINSKINLEFQKEREIEELKHQEKLKMMRLQQEKERIEKMKILNELKYKQMREEIKNKNNMINNNYMLNNNSNNNKFDFSIENMFKLFIMKKIQKSNNLPFNFNNFNNISNMNFSDMINYMIYSKMMAETNNSNSTLLIIILITLIVSVILIIIIKLIILLMN